MLLREFDVAVPLPSEIGGALLGATFPVWYTALHQAFAS